MGRCEDPSSTIAPYLFFGGGEGRVGDRGQGRVGEARGGRGVRRRVSTKKEMVFVKISRTGKENILIFYAEITEASAAFYCSIHILSKNINMYTNVYHFLLFPTNFFRKRFRWR